MVLLSARFQSSPFPKEERYMSCRILRLLPQVFQSSPFPKEGRYLKQAIQISAACSFNPRPSRRKGATGKKMDDPSVPIVSILALPEGRALLSPGNWIGSRCRFQSSPFPKEGRYVVQEWMGHKSIQFQSSPFPKEGRYSQFAGIGGIEEVFQSSPFPKEGRYAAPLQF